MTGHAGAAGKRGIQLSGTVRSNGIGQIDLTGTTAATANQSQGVYLNASHSSGVLLSSVDGAITIRGTSSGGIGSGTQQNRGILLDTYGNTGPVVIESTGTATITMIGQGSSAGEFRNSGVHLFGDGAEVRSSQGAIQITGTGGNGTGSANHGVSIERGAKVVATGNASVTITGTAGEGTGWSDGVNVVDVGSQIVTENGGLTIVGTRSASTNGNHHGIRLNAANALVATGTGGITLRADGNIVAEAGTTVTTQGGHINFFANTAGTGGNIRLLGSGANRVGISSNGGNITLAGGWDGTGAAVGSAAVGGTDETSGIFSRRADLDAGGGNILLNGKGISANDTWETPGGRGVLLNGGSLLTSGVGTVTVQGESVNGTGIVVGPPIGGSEISTGAGPVEIAAGTGAVLLKGDGQNGGILVNHLDAHSDGSITLRGTGKNNGGAGVGLSSSAVSGTKVNLTTSGNILIEGEMEVSGWANSRGVQIGNASTGAADETSLKTTGGGTIEIKGYITGNGGAVAAGVDVGGNVVVETESGALTVDGGSSMVSGAIADGVLLAGGATLRTGDGAIVVTADYAVGNGTIGIDVGTGGAVIESTSGDITLTADRMNWDGAPFTVGSDGTLRVQQFTAGTSIGLGDAASGTLNLTNAELDALEDGFEEITIGGDALGGDVDAAGYAFKDSVTIQGGNIGLDGALSTTDANDSITLRAADNISVAAGSTVTTDGGAINFYANADGTDSGNIRLLGATNPSGLRVGIVSNGGNITLAGGWNGTTAAVGTAAAGSADDTSGIFIRRADLDAGGGDILLNGKGISPNGGWPASPGSGVLLNGGKLLTVGTGTVTVQGESERGIGIAVGPRSGGPEISMTADPVEITAGTGEVKLTGTGYTNGILVNHLKAHTGGDITLRGEAEDSGGAGVGLSSSSSAGTKVDLLTSGNILIDGKMTVTTTSVASRGVRIANVSTGTADQTSLKTTGNGIITIQGDIIGRSGAADVVGVSVGGNVVVETESGALTVDGGGSPGTGIVTHGVLLDGGATLRTDSGEIGVTANSATSFGVGTGGAVIESTSGDITLTADRMNWDGTPFTVGSGGILRIEQFTAGTSIGLGDAASGTLNLTNAELDALQDGFSEIIIGRGESGVETPAGEVDVTGYAFKDKVTIQGGNIGLDGALSTTDVNDSITLRAADNIVAEAGSTVTTQGGDINFYANADGNGGNIRLLGATSSAGARVGISSNGGDITLAGGWNGTEAAVGSAAAGSADDTSGIFSRRADLDAGGGDILLNGKGISPNGGWPASPGSGVLLNGGKLLTVGTGTVTVLGESEHGIGIAVGPPNGGPEISTGAGPVEITAGTGAVLLKGDGHTGGVLANHLNAHTGGDITLRGTGKDSGGAGVSLSSSSSQGTKVNLSTSGNILIDGEMEVTTTSANSRGVLIGNVSTGAANQTSLKATGNGTITIKGMVDNDRNTAGVAGVRVGGNVVVETESGALTVEGGSLAGSGAIAHGVLLDGGATLKTDGGEIGVTASYAAGNSATGFNVGTGGAAIESTSGDITLTADRMDWEPGAADTRFASSGELRIEQFTAGTSIGVGTGAIGDLHLSDAEFGTLQDGFSEIIIGRGDGTGAITVNTAHEFEDSLRLLTDGTSGTVAIGSALSVGTGNGNHLVIHSGGTVATASQITADGLRLAGTANYSLTGDNRIGTVAKGIGDANGSVVIHNDQTLTVGTVDGASGLNGSTVEVRVGTGDLVLNSAVNASAPGEGNVVLSVADPNGHFINTVGGGAIGTNGGSWKIYLPGLDGHTFGNLASGSHAIYGQTIGSLAPGSAPVGNRYIFAERPVLDITSSFSHTKIYGDAYTFPTPLTEVTHYTVGYVNANDYGDVFLQDDATSIGLSGLNTMTLSSAGEAANAAANAAGYAIALNQGSVALAPTSGYDLGAFTSTGKLVVDKRAVTVTVDPGQHKTYGAPDPASYTYTNTSLGGGIALSGALTRDPGQDAGTYNILQGGLTDANNTNYNITFVGNVFTIEKATLNVFATPGQNKVYGSSNPVYSYTYNGLVNSDTDAVFSGALNRELGENVGFYAINQGNLSAGSNYTINFTGADFEITKRAITIGSNAGLSKMYGEDDPSGLASQYAVTGGLGLVGTDSLTGLMLREAGEGVGSRNFLQGSVGVSDGNGGGNYAITFDGTTNKFAITQRTGLTASIADQSKIYGENDPAIGGIGVTLGGLVNRTVSTINGNVALNDTGNVATTLASLTRDPGENVNSYAYTAATFNALTGSASDNYAAPTFQAGSVLEIGKRAITVRADSGSSVYGDTPVNPGISLINGTTTAFGHTLADLGLGNNFNLVYNSNAGTYTINVTQAGGALAANYDIGTETGLFTIGKRDITLGSNAGLTKMYGEDDPAGLASEFDVTIGSLVAGDVLSGAMTREAGEGVGSRYFIRNTAGITTANGGDNYHIAFDGTTNQLAITARTGLTASIQDQHKTYGDADPLPGGIVGGVTLHGLVNGTVNTINGTVNVNDTGNVTAALTALGRADTSENVGSYAYTSGTVALTGGGNYAGATFVTSGPDASQLHIGKRAITVRADSGSSIYGDTPVNPGISLASGSLGFTDTLASIGLGNDFALVYNSNAGTYAIHVTGMAGATNYDIDTETGLFTIGKRNITLGSNAGLTKMYGEDDPTGLAGAFGVTVGSLVAGDVLSGAMTREVGENVGSRYFIQSTAGITTANGGDNYNITFDGMTNRLVITARTGLTASIANQSKIYGENDPAIGGIGVTLGGLVNGTVNTINGAVNVNDTGNVATTLASLTRDTGEDVGSYAYTAATFDALTGSASGNYSAPTFVTGPVLNIGQRAITVRAGSGTSIYGETPTDPGISLVGGSMGFSDNLASIGLGNDFALVFNSNVGTYTINVTGMATATNYDITTETGSYTITPRAITIGSNAGLTKVYGEDDPTGLAGAYGVTAGSIVTGDSLTGLMGREVGENVGNRNFTQNTVTVNDGNGGANYTITFNGTTNPFAITQRGGLTASIANQSKTYGENDPAIGGIGVTLGGLVNGTVNTINGAVNVNDTGNVATTLASLTRDSGENVNSYAYTAATFNALTGSAAGNYAAPTFQLGSVLNIGQRAITLTADAATKIYGEADPASYSASVTGGLGLATGDSILDVTGTLTREAGQNVGAYDVYLGTGTKAGNYNITFNADNNAFTITPASLTITANNQTKTYGDALPFAGTEFTSLGLQNGETIGSVTLASGGAVNTAGVLGSPYTITIGGATGGSFDINNYTVTYVNGALTVNPRDITVTALGGTSVYGQSPANPGLTATNLASFDTVAALTGLSNSFGITPTTAAGTYGLTVAGALTNPNYNVTATFGQNWIVTQKALTITARNQSKTYGDTFLFNPAYDGVNGHYTVSGLINGDSVSSADLASLGAADTATVNGGTPYGITIGNASGTGLGNYLINYVDGGLTVTPRNITVTANGGTSTYGDNPANPGLTASNLASFDNVSALTGLSNSFGINALTNAGSHALTVNGTLSNENYNVTQRIGGTWVVNPKGVVVTALGGTSTYGDTPGNPGLSATGLVNGQDVSVLTGLYNSFGIGATTPAGDHALYVLGTLTNGNYKVDGLVNGNWHVNRKALTVTANNLSKTYGDAYSFSGTEFTTSGLINGDSVGWASISSGGAAASATVAGSPYTINIGGALGSGLGNYNISYVTGLFTVDKRALNITANNLTKTYGDVYTFAGTEFSTGTLYNGDSVTSATLSSAGAAATATVAGSPYTINIGGAVGSGLDNYDINYTTGLFTVDQRALTITANNLSKTYGDTLTFAGTEFGSSGLQNGETIGSVTLTSAGAFNTATVPGSPYAITIGNATGGTFDINNYAVTYVNGALTVNKRDITVTANGGSSTYGDSPANPGLSATNLASFDTGANVSALLGLSNSFGITATTNAGTHTLNVLGTVSNPNYNVTDRISGTWTVGQRVLTITANNQTKTYGDTFTFTGSEFTPTGLQNGETIGSVTLTSAGAVNTATVPGSPYAIVASNAVGGTFNIGNYAVTYVDGQLTVNKRDITVTANGGSSIYGDSPANPGLGATNLASFDTVAALTGLYNSFGITSTTAAGNHTLTVAGTLTNPNYNVTQFNTGIWTVGQRALTITANDRTKIYGDTLNMGTTDFSSLGLQNGETIGGVTLTSAGAVDTAGVAGSPYSIVASAATGGTFNIANYDVIYVDGQLTVTPRKINVTANGGSSIYGDSPANPGISADNMASFEVGQENTLLTGLYNSFGIGATTPAGDHALHVLGTLTNGNYEVVGRIDGNWHVGTKQLDITANDQSRIYGDSFAFNGTEFTSVGLINGDQVNWVDLASAATNEQLGVGSYAITASGALGTGLSNYHILYHDGSFTVTPRKVTVTANGGSSVYGQSPANPGLSADNLAHFDSIADLTGLYNSFGITSTTGAGVYTLNVLGTLTNPNYDVIGRVPGIWTVGQAALTITPHQAFRFVHQPNPPFSVFANGFQPGDGFWSLGGDLGYLTDANYYSLAGDYAVYPTGVNAANYNITFTQGTLTVVDNPMLLKDMANPIQFLQTKDDEEEEDAEKGEIRYEERKTEEKVISTLTTGDLQVNAEN